MPTGTAPVPRRPTAASATLGAPTAAQARITRALTACLLVTGCGGRGPGDVAPPALDPGVLAGIETGWTSAGCQAGDGARTSSEELGNAGPRLADTDRDGLADTCELALAIAFAPLLVVEARVCDWDTDTVDPRPAGAYLFGARPLPGGRVRLAYLPAYTQDCGWSGPKCVLLGTECDGHTGDSEVIGIDVRPGTGTVWATTAVFLSAHCFRDAACRWYAGDDLDAFQWVDGRPGGAPVVWVAAGTNANYRSRSACDAGHRFLDTCDRNDTEVRFPILDGRQNVGSRTRPFMERLNSGCLGAAETPLIPADVDGDPPAEECFWSDVPFRGWIRPPAGVPPTPYVVYLREILGF